MILSLYHYILNSGDDECDHIIYSQQYFYKCSKNVPTTENMKLVFFSVWFIQLIESGDDDYDHDHDDRERFCTLVSYIDFMAIFFLFSLFFLVTLH